jgi:hypothetical protein
MYHPEKDEDVPAPYDPSPADQDAAPVTVPSEERTDLSVKASKRSVRVMDEGS